jgi:hypothetical protein
LALAEFPANFQSGGLALCLVTSNTNGRCDTGLKTTNRFKN